MNIAQDRKWTWPTPSAPYRGDNKLSYKSDAQAKTRTKAVSLQVDA